MEINVKFTYHNVGQGLFYTGKMGGFNFVYDCGSENKSRLNSSISQYTNNGLGRNILNLLIISHFHDDHTIGLDKLLQDLSVDTVILPYLTPVERLIISLQKLYLPGWYYEFLSDPVDFLFKKDVKRIVIIGGTEGEKGGLSPERLPPNKPENTEINLEKMEDDKALKEKVNKYEPKWHGYIGKKLLLKNHCGYITSLSGFWIFKFFNYKLEEQNLSGFEECLRQNGFVPDNSESLRNIIKDKHQRSKLRSCYKILKGDLNHTSLIVYHGPISRYKSSVTCFYKDFHFPSIYFSFYGHLIPPYECSNEIGQFLTGDVNLNIRWKDIENHFDKFFKNISISQVPHHGAKRNWNKTLLNIIWLKKSIMNHSSWIVSAGISNKYGHPHIAVLDDLINNRKCLCWSNEFNEVNIEGNVRW